MRSSLNKEFFKEPRGFLKVIEIFLAIFAFSCASGYRGYFKIMQTYSSTTVHPVEGYFQYPFDGPISVTVSDGNNTISTDVPLDERSSAEFFLVVGVFCFIHSVIILVYYVAFQEDQTNNAPTTGSLTPPIIDFVTGAFWTFFWFVSSCAQIAAVNGIKDQTNADKLIKSLEVCNIPNMVCTVADYAEYATLTVSILFGFLNTFVWGGNMWFLWKETRFHKENDNAVPAVFTQPARPSNTV